LKRRTFLQIGAAAFAASSLPLISLNEAVAASGKNTSSSSLFPRRVELLDPDWRFEMEAPIVLSTPITDWLWTPGTPDQQAAILAPNVDTSSWKKTTPGDNTLAENSYGWFRTILPNIPGPGRLVHFEGVDDNGTVFLNGQPLLVHQGWDQPFEVNLDPAWVSGGQNVLVVLVQNIGGAGGITKAVTAGTLPPRQECYAVDYDDSKWETVHLPHDYVVTGVFDPKLDVGHGALPVGSAWYRKNVDVPKSDKGKTAWLYFEGVFRNATVYVNGQKAYFQDDGYDPFNVDITDLLNYGKSNVIAVHVDARGGEGWWYEGGGIYRHVWLNLADPVHIIPWGVYVTSDVKNVLTTPSATLSIQTDLINKGLEDTPITLTTNIVDPKGNVLATVTSDGIVPGASTLHVSQNAQVDTALLWSLETRNLYQAVTAVTANGKVIDRHNQTFGIRTIRFDPDHGFFLNEVRTELQGTCNHQDFCGVGIAMTDSILYWRMKTLKERLGCNAIRCSHNPMTSAMYDACDELGLVVMDETRHPGDAVETKASDSSTFSHTEHIEKMICRDRNHPSVIMWSMANEEWQIQNAPYGATMLAALMKAIHKHDATRPVTTADNSGTDPGWMVGFGSVEDLLGVNYNYQDYDWLHGKYPNKPIFGSETASDLSCRGIYETDDVAGHRSSYMTPEGSWRPLGEREFVCGGFVWTGFDYRGEPTPYGWPEISSNFGLLDTCGFPKDAAYYYKAWWKQDEPLVHIFPHWNWAGKEGQKVPVWCFSNCDKVELFLNGVSQGALVIPKFGHVQWDDVIYAPGTVKAVGYMGGQAVMTDTVLTTGTPAAIKLSADRSLLSADGEDTIPVEVRIIDANGLVVPTAGNLVTFAVRGEGTNAGVGNGDPASHELNQVPARSAFAGLCMVLVKATSKPGDIVLTATADGLKAATLTFKSS
jgi:beta-galactosidase